MRQNSSPSQKSRRQPRPQHAENRPISSPARPATALLNGRRCSRFTIWLPITPRPTKPKFAIPQTFFQRPWQSGSCFALGGENARVFPYLLQVSPHRIPRSAGVALLDRLQDALMVILSALRSAVHVKNSQALFAQQAHDGINQGQDDGVLRRLGERK